MPKSLPIPVILLLCISCSRYQYVTLSSADVEKNEKNEFVIENDSLKLVYNFNGFRGPVNIAIQNKLSVPVYIDWQRSAMIVNDKAISYVPKEVQIDGNFQGSSYNYRNNGYRVTDGELHAVASLPPTIDFIPPRAIITKMPLYVAQGYMESIPDMAYHKEKYIPVEGLSVTVKRATFTEASSPLRFRSFITYMVGEPATKSFAFEHSFFISEIMTSGAGPETILINSNNRGDLYYTSKVTTGGQAGAAVGLSAILAGIIIAGQNSSSNNNDGN